MAELVADCPRCGTKQITFAVPASTFAYRKGGWQDHYETFSVCRNCRRATIFVLAEKDATAHALLERAGGPGKFDHVLNPFVIVAGFVNIRDLAIVAPPEHVPSNIEAAFREGATCLATECWNAAGTMFRLCVDLATKPLVPQPQDGQPEPTGLSKKVRRDLGLRLPWLFDNGKLPDGLRDLSACIKDDGNDGAHAGTLTKVEAEDLLDFTRVLLERIYTEPARVKIAAERRAKRREDLSKKKG